MGNHVEGTAQIIGNFNLFTKNQASAIGVLGSYNSVTQNSVVTSEYSDVGIELASGDHNVFYDNTVGYSMGAGISIGYGMVIDYHGIGGGSYNIFAGNTIDDAHLWGALLGNGSYNVFYGNLVENCGGLGHDGYGLAMGGTEYKMENNLVFYNSFMNNYKNFGGNWQVIGANVFDNGSVGNYWDDYLTVYPNASAVGNTGTGNMPDSVYGDSMDNHPLLNKPEVSAVVPSLPAPWSTLLSSALTAYASLSASQSPSLTTPNITIQPTGTDNPDGGNQSEPQQGVPETTFYAVVVCVVVVSVVAAISIRWKKRVEVSLASSL
jgi:parallel beta-helix repeat protein